MNDLYCWESKFESCYYSESFLNKISEINNALHFQDQIDLYEVKKAIYYAKKYYGNQKRYSGEPYYTHPLQVAFMVAGYVFNTDILITSILHDILEDTTLTYHALGYIFSKQIATNVYDLSKNKLHGKINAGELIEKLWIQKKKNELLLIKLIDRMHNIQTISPLSLLQKEKIIAETLLRFLPIAISKSLFSIEIFFDQYCNNIINQMCNFHMEQYSMSESLTIASDEYSQALDLAFQNETLPT